MTDFSEILDQIPNYNEYLNFSELNANSDQLAKAHPETVKLLDLGKSAAGKPIKCLKIGKGRHHALLYGFPNPEEPLGGVLIDYFSHALAEHESLLRDLDYTWYFIKCIDPDGAELNEGFLKGPLTPLNFAKNYYRAPETRTAEENFPYRYGDVLLDNPLPETRALMKIMDEASLDFVSSFHNMKWGGITYQVPEPCPELYAHLQDVAKAQGIFLRKRLGTMLAPGIQLAGYLTPARNYVMAKAAGKGPLQQITGAYVFEYAQILNPRVFMLIPECSLWYDPRCYDDRPSDNTWAEVIESASKVDSETNEFLASLYRKTKPLLETPSPFLDMIGPIIKEIETPTVNVLDPGPEVSKKELQRTATIAEKIETEGRADIYRLFNLGAMIRMVDYELAHREKRSPILAACRADAAGKLEEWNRDLEQKYDCKAHPIRSLIGLNLGSILHSAEYVKWRKRSS